MSIKSQSRRIRHPGIQTRFLAWLAFILLGFCILTATLIYIYQKNALEEEAFRKIRLIMNVVEATNSYVREVLRPKMYEVVGHDVFIIEAMSTSYVSRTIMERFKLVAPEVVYRRAAINARNPNFEASQQERNMIRYFAENPNKQSWQGIRETAGKRFFMHFSPVYFTESCLHCHGDLTEAPQKIIEMYDTKRGFQRYPDKLMSVVSISIPVEAELNRFKGIAFSVFALGFLGVFFLYTTIYFFFNRLIVQNLRTLLDIFRGSLNDEKSLHLYEVTKNMDEIAELTATADVMATHLQESRDQLKNYALDLERKKEILQSVFDGITDFVVLLDRNGTLKMVNKALAQGYGVDVDDIVGQGVEELAVRAPVPFSLFTTITAVELKEPVIDQHTLPNGKTYEVHFYPVFTEQGGLESIVCYAEDVTRQKEIDQQAQQTEKLVALGQLASGVAHEINNPLGIILCYVDLLTEDLHQLPKTTEDLKIIAKHARNCQHIVADLLNFASSRPMIRKSAYINRIIKETATMMAPQLRKEQVDITLSLDPAMPMLNLDQEKMKQVLVNLLMNGAQSITDKGEIKISSHHHRVGQVEIIVEDNGCGIPDAIINKIFEPFFTSKEPGRGTGLGLSVSYGIIKDHGGEIRVKSKPGKWTRFRILLPENGSMIPVKTSEIA